MFYVSRQMGLTIILQPVEVTRPQVGSEEMTLYNFFLVLMSFLCPSTQDLFELLLSLSIAACITDLYSTLHLLCVSVFIISVTLGVIFMDLSHVIYTSLLHACDFCCS